jgi:hypothetical protein
MPENKQSKVIEWSVEIIWNDGVSSWLRDTDLYSSTQKQVNKNINSIWQNAIDVDVNLSLSNVLKETRSNNNETRLI